MNAIRSFLILTAILFGAYVRAQVVLQNFSSTVGSNTYFYGTWEAAGNTDGTTSPNANFFQGAGVFDITGTTGLIPTNDASSKVDFYNAPVVSIGSNTSLSVSAQTLATNVASSFTVTLFDTSAKKASAAFSTVDFVTGSYTTITAPLTFDSGFDAVNFEFMRVSGNQPGGTDRFNVSFDNISAVTAVPEPATYAALAGVGALGFAAWRRRRAGRRAG